MLPPGFITRGCCRFYRALLLLAACLLVMLLFAGCQRDQERGSGRTLEHADSIRALSPSELRRGYPVSLHGQVTYFDLRLGILTLQDSTAGIAIDTSGHFAYTFYRPGN